MRTSFGAKTAVGGKVGECHAAIHDGADCGSPAAMLMSAKSVKSRQSAWPRKLICNNPLGTAAQVGRYAASHMLVWVPHNGKHSNSSSGACGSGRRGKRLGPHRQPNAVPRAGRHGGGR